VAVCQKGDELLFLNITGMQKQNVILITRFPVMSKSRMTSITIFFSLGLLVNLIDVRSQLSHCSCHFKDKIINSENFWKKKICHLVPFNWMNAHDDTILISIFNGRETSDDFSMITNYYYIFSDVFFLSAKYNISAAVIRGVVLIIVFVRVCNVLQWQHFDFFTW